MPDAEPTRDQGTELRILEAAHTIFLRRGTDGARMQEIADEAGVNKGLLHYYYRSKERLAREVFRRAAAELMSEVVPILGSDLELEDKIDRFVAAELRLFSARPYLPGYVLSEVTLRPDRLLGVFADAIAGPMRRRVLPRLRAQIAAGAAAGTVAAPLTAEQFLVTCLSGCVFPFAARPLLATVLGLDEAGFQRFIAERGDELPAFLKRGLRP